MSSEPALHEADPTPSLRYGKLALALAFVALALVLIPQFVQGAPRISGSNHIMPGVFVFDSNGAARVCQDDTTLHEGTAAVRATIGTYDRASPPLRVEWRKGGRVLARGSLPAGWTEGVVRVPIAPRPAETVLGASVCFILPSATSGRVAWAGEPVPVENGATVDNRPQPGRVSVVSEAAGKPSLLSLWHTIAERYAAGNAGWMGAWTMYLILVLVLASLAAAGAALLYRGERRRWRVPLAGWLCTLSAALGLTAWALLTPPMHVPDEIAHVAYVQTVVESGELPLVEPDSISYSEQERNLLAGLDFYGVIGRIDSRPPWSDVQEARLRAWEDLRASRDSFDASSASANPPLYYLLEAPVYWATPSGDLLDKLLPLRLVSALLGALTVLAAFLFLRELLPRSPWLWPAGALVCAFQPVFGFISSGVNADALLFAASALTFLGMARILRRGLTVRRAVFLGAAVAVGVLSKPLFLGLIPAVALAVLIAAWRAKGRPVRELLAPLGIAAAVAAVPVLLYHLIGGAAFDHPYFPRGSTVGHTLATDATGSLREQLSFVWQLWLPRVPIFADQFPGPLPLRAIWIGNFLGRFGWLDYGFPGWVLTVFTVTSAVVLVAAVATLIVHRDKLRGRWAEFGVYAVAVIGIAGIIGTYQYRAVVDGTPAFTQARYLLPLFVLYGGIVIVALRLAGRRVGPYLAIAAVTLAAMHGLSAMILTVSRYYA